MSAEKSGCLSFLFGRPRKEEKTISFPYKAKEYLLSKQEQAFYHKLRQAVGRRAAICPKVRMGDVFYVSTKDNSERTSANNRIQKKHVDFLLCDPHSMSPLVAIELDDKSHERESRQDRDGLVDRIFEAGGLALVHIKAKDNPTAEQLAALLSEYLPQPTPG